MRARTRWFRTTIFWAHLSVGLTVGLVVLLMSVTGVILTYERQILRFVDDNTTTSTAPRLTADEFVDVALTAARLPSHTTVTLRYSSRDHAPVLASIGRSHQFLLDPGTADILRHGRSPLNEFFGTVTSIHRWFALEGEARSVGRAITGYANLGFLFLLVSGVYLWLPRLWNGAMLRSQILLKRRYATGRAQDWAWHHVFSFWAALPLLLIISTATVFYFPWSNAMVYGAFGESVPERRGASGAVSPVEDALNGSPAGAGTVERQLARGLAMAESKQVPWRTLTVEASLTPDSNVVLRFDETFGGVPQAVRALTLSPGNAEVPEPRWSTFAERSPGSRARSIVRFLHTGEVLGLPGQTVAGLASFAACMLVWSGYALAWRRLIRPILIERTRSQNLT